VTFASPGHCELESSTRGRGGRSMKHNRFSDEQVIGMLNEHETGAKVDDFCRRQHAISTATPKLL
jgi:hypothetical protein